MSLWRTAGIRGSVRIWVSLCVWHFVVALEHPQLSALKCDLLIFVVISYPATPPKHILSQGDSLCGIQNRPNMFYLGWHPRVLCTWIHPSSHECTSYHYLFFTPSSLVSLHHGSNHQSLSLIVFFPDTTHFRYRNIFGLDLHLSFHTHCISYHIILLAIQLGITAVDLFFSFSNPEWMPSSLCDQYIHCKFRERLQILLELRY